MQDDMTADAADALPPDDTPLADAPPEDGTAADAPAGDLPAADVAVASEPVAAEPAAETPEPTPERRDREDRADRPGKERGNRPRGEGSLLAERSLRRFQACGRCSYFIADCQVKLGREVVNDAIATAREGWLELACDSDVKRLIHNAYGVETDISAYYFDATCPECRRRFTFADNSAEEQPSLLRVALS